MLKYILRTKHTYVKVHFENEAYILVGRKFLNHIGWKETSKSSDKLNFKMGELLKQPVYVIVLV